MIYFTADQHFGHKNIIRLCKRPFKDTDEMNKVLTESWNSVVQPDDTVYVVGDFAYKMHSMLHVYAKALNGHKHIILGNHDKLPHIEYERNFESVEKYSEIDVEGQRIVLFHYPILSWNRRARGSWHLYGHVHTAGQMWQIANQKTFNVGVDTNNFKPISFMDLKLYMINKGIGPFDSEDPGIREYDKKT